MGAPRLPSSTKGDHIPAGWTSRNSVVRSPSVAGLKAKDLVGIPEQLALALQADGWYWRSRIPWIKRNCMPESCRDRPATAVEYVMMFSKSAHYFYDREAVKVRAAGTAHERGDGVNPKAKVPSGWDQENHGRAGNGRFRPRQNESFSGVVNKVVKERNRRNSDWFMESWQGLLTDEDGDPLALVVNTRPYKDAHFATFPPRLVRPFILAGCPEGGTVLDPFGGSGTTGMVALEYGRKAILIELKPEYVEMQKKRLRPVAGRPLLAFGGNHGQ
jgi:site-specific DNA-methyltransferase (adenine-specific)